MAHYAMAILGSRSRLLAATFAAIGLAIALHALHAVTDLGHPAMDDLVTNWVYTAIEFAAVGVCLARVLRRREERVAWAFICVGLIAWSAGDLTWTVWLENLPNPPYPSLADGLYLTMYPSIFIGLVLLMRSHFRHTGAPLWLDGVVVGLTLAAFGADLIFPAVHAAGNASATGVALNLGYLLGDLLLLVFVAVAFALAAWRPGRQWLLLAVGIAVMAGADMLFLYQEAKGTYVAGGLLDTMWPTSMALLALAAWQPVSRRARPTIMGRHTVALTAIFGAGALALLVSATLHPLTRLSVALATGALFAAGVRATYTYLDNMRMLARQTHDAVTDALTGLGNRRRLMDDLDLAVARGLLGEPSTLVFFDLNGFKQYNDSFGHTAGDALLQRLGSALVGGAQGHGQAYRLGGDEFCVLLDGSFGRDHPLVADLQSALSEQGRGFVVTASVGVVIVSEEADSVGEALRRADERMYAEKSSGRRAGHQQTQGVLMQLLTEREPSLHDHVCDVGELAVAIGRRFALDSEQLDELRRAAELHDIGKLALPEQILRKAGPLSDGEHRFMRQHTLIGERILSAAPALRLVARLVRSSHERWDGQGYPDRLAGSAIPLGARIIAACDAYDAMVSDRSYRAGRTAGEAIAELRRQAGSQFDPEVVETLAEHLADGAGAHEQRRSNSGRADSLRVGRRPELSRSRAR